MSSKKKREIISFKVDPELSKAMEGIPNRSEIIRNAILAALEGTCPLCLGTGILTPEQQEHWQEFRHNHTLEKCPDCRAVHIVCTAEN